MKVSVIILNWNGEEMLKRYLGSVMQYSADKDVEVVLADNGSTDNSIATGNEIAATYPTTNYRTIALKENYGFAEGYNRALAETNADYTILLNSDVEVTEGWLTPMIEYLDAHEEIAAVQPKVMSWQKKTYFEYAGAAGGYLDKLCYPYCRGRILGHIEEDKGQYDTIAEVFWATGACLCVRTSVYKELGGLDGDFFAHMEEIDLCWRMNCRGWHLACVPQSKVYHLGGGSLNYENPKKTFLNFRNSLLMIYKNMPSKHLFGVLTARFILDIAASLHYLFTGKGANAWAVVKAWGAFIRLRGNFKEKRNINILKVVIPYPSTIVQRSILVDYYFRGKRT